MKPIPPLKTLIPFHAVARHLSCTKAAQECCVTHSAISQSIKQLETYLGKPLFDRNKNQYTLNDIGKVYFEHIDAALHSIQSATQHILQPTSPNTIRVNMLCSYAMHWLIPRLHAFQIQYPEIQLTLSSDWQPEHCDYTKYDCAIVYGDHNWPKSRASFLFNDDIALLASPKIMQKKDSAELKYLYVVADKRPDNLTLYHQHFNQAEPCEQQRNYFQNTLQVRQAAIHGHGIMAGNVHFLNGDIESGRLAMVSSTIAKNTKGFYLVSQEGSSKGKQIERFRDWLLSQR